ncbi:MAG: DUF4124 domain-containing protein [Gammaproteobacteria bacterium]|nr:DUF4124 domain-containing protein [Gammaproteobacteria bacterium]
MVRFSGVVCALLMAGVAAVAGAETVYKWVDGSGQIHYTDVPPGQPDARILGVYQKEAGTIDEEESADDSGGGGGGDDWESPPEAGPASPGTPEPPPSEAAMAASQADTAKAQAQQCQVARERYQRYVESRRLYRETPDGKREYLTDKELTEARARAKQTVDDYCS